jgi:hypothetical protein
MEYDDEVLVAVTVYCRWEVLMKGMVISSSQHLLFIASINAAITPCQPF